MFRTPFTLEDAAAAGLWTRVPVVRTTWLRSAPGQGRAPQTFSWNRGAGEAHRVTPRLFDRMAPLASPAASRLSRSSVTYLSEEAAREALSRAAVGEG